jgi:hypothetical protein
MAVPTVASILRRTFCINSARPRLTVTYSIEQGGANIDKARGAALRLRRGYGALNLNRWSSGYRISRKGEVEIENRG